MATASKLFIQIDNDRIELTGEDKEQFLAERKAEADAKALVDAEFQAKQDARNLALQKLAEAAGLTADEIAALLA
jgi:hypothetical protein